MHIVKRATAFVAAALFGLFFSASPGQAQQNVGMPMLPSVPVPLKQYYRDNPAAWDAFVAQLPRVQPSPPTVFQPPAGEPVPGAWTAVTPPPGGAKLSNPLLLTDGSVIAHVSCTALWYKLTPSSTATFANSYIQGTWTPIASLPLGYGPRFFSSAVLPDGRVIVEGGEYNGNGFCSVADTTQGAIYDPVANTWTPVTPPPGFGTIGDAQAVVLADGTYLQSTCCDSAWATGKSALFNPATLTWTITGNGKVDSYDEEGWSLLPNGKVLTVDTYVPLGSPPPCGTGSELYDRTGGGGAGTWSAGPSTIVQLADCNSAAGKLSYELGPQILRPDGTLVAFGGNTTGVAHTSIYNSGTNSWAAGPNMPSFSGTPYTQADAPAALLPNGNVLIAASPSNWSAANSFLPPTHFWELEFPGNTFTPVADPPGISNTMTSYQANFLLLPTGQVFFVGTDFGNAQVYTPNGGPQASWRPTITNISSSTLLAATTYHIDGVQLSGLSDGTAYGDDVQAATNFPLVKITLNNGHIYYARTFNHSTRTVAANASGGTDFRLAANMETGAGSLTVVTNGIESTPAVPVTITGALFSLSVSAVGSGTVASTDGKINCGATCSASYAAGTAVMLAATPAAGFVFSGWAGACGGSGGCTVTMDSAKNVTATFTLQQQSFILGVTAVGGGTVTSNVGGINCPTTCSASYVAGTSVTLSATPAAGFVFSGWAGACGGSGGCTVTMDSAKNVTATFAPVQQQQVFALTVSTSGNGSVTSSPSGIDCGSTCSAVYSSGTQVNLTANPATGFVFTGWGGACGGPGACSVTMDAAKSVSANFALGNFALTVQLNGSGLVVSSPAGINCGANCSAGFPGNVQVMLTAAPANGFSFTGWGGACGGIGSCAVTMNQAQSVSATFTQTGTQTALLAAVLPSSRSVKVGTAATAFATIINSGPTPASGCSIAPASAVPVAFAYQTTDPKTNAVTGSPNTPVDIGSGGAQSFVIALTPTAAFDSTVIPFSFACTNASPAPSQTGLNTLLMSASTDPIPDVVALAATTSNDGVLHIPGSNAAAAFSVATVNLGAASSITVNANTGSASPPLAILVCQTDPELGNCITPVAPSVTTTIGAGATPTFGIFGTASGAIPFDPAGTRIFVSFTDPIGVVRGSTSVAVTTQ